MANDCVGGLPLLLMFVFLSLALNQVLPRALDWVGETATYAALTLSVPLSAIMLTVFYTETDFETDIGRTWIPDMVTLPLVVGGLVCYRWNSQYGTEILTALNGDAGDAWSSGE